MSFLKGLLKRLKPAQTQNGVAPGQSAVVVYTEEELDAVEAHISSHFGKYDKVFHEIYSSDIHCDVVCILPTTERNFYTLVTMGAGASPMNVPKELRRYSPRRAEYLVTLPPNWDIEHLDEPHNYWPIGMMKELARTPIEHSTWLGYGHTISEGEDSPPFSDNTNLCSVVLTFPEQFGEDALSLTLPTGDDIIFYQMNPIYMDELKFKMKYGANALEQRMGDVLRKPLDIARSSTVNKNR